MVSHREFPYLDWNSNGTVIKDLWLMLRGGSSKVRFEDFSKLWHQYTPVLSQLFHGLAVYETTKRNTGLNWKLLQTKKCFSSMSLMIANVFVRKENVSEMCVRIFCCLTMFLVVLFHKELIMRHTIIDVYVLERESFLHDGCTFVSHTMSRIH